MDVTPCEPRLKARVLPSGENTGLKSPGIPGDVSLRAASVSSESRRIDVGPLLAVPSQALMLFGLMRVSSEVKVVSACSIQRQMWSIKYDVTP